MTDFSKSILGEWPIYPGHPLTTALVIMHRFDNLAAAQAKTEFGWPAAVGNGDVDGAGGQVYSALRLLQDIEGGKLSVETAPEEARRRWLDSEAGGLISRVEPAQEQADRFVAQFLEMASGWFEKADAEPAQI